MGIFRSLSLGEPHGRLFAKDLAVYEALAGFAGRIGLGEAQPHTVGYKTHYGEGFTDDLDHFMHDTFNVVVREKNKHAIAVLLYSNPVVASVCHLELIEAKQDDPKPPDALYGLNQLHYIFDTETVKRIADANDAELIVAGSESNMNFAKLPLDEDTHIKIRDHSAFELVVDELTVFAAQLDNSEV